MDEGLEKGASEGERGGGTVPWTMGERGGRVGKSGLGFVAGYILKTGLFFIAGFWLKPMAKSNSSGNRY